MIIKKLIEKAREKVKGCLASKKLISSRSGVSYDTINRITNGAKKNPTEREVLAIIRACRYLDKKENKVLT